MVGIAISDTKPKLNTIPAYDVITIRSKIDPTTSVNATTHHFTPMLIVYGRFKLYNILQGLIFYIFILKSPHYAPCQFSIHSNPAHDVFHLGRWEFHALFSPLSFNSLDLLQLGRGDYSNSRIFARFIIACAADRTPVAVRIDRSNSVFN
jgi:hypothetical protein